MMVNVRTAHAPQPQVDPLRTFHRTVVRRLRFRWPLLLTSAMLASGLLALAGCGRGPLPVLTDAALLVSIDELAAEIAAPPADAPILGSPAGQRPQPTAQDAVDIWAGSSSPFTEGEVLYSGPCVAGTEPILNPVTLCVSVGPVPDVYYLGPGESTPWYVLGIKADASGATLTGIARGTG